MKGKKEIGAEDIVVIITRVNVIGLVLWSVVFDYSIL